MLEYIKKMLHKEELLKQAKPYDYDILNIVDGYLSIPPIKENVVFACVAGTIGVWDMDAFEKLEQEIALLPDSREKRLVTRSLLSRAYYAERTPKGYEFSEWFQGTCGGCGKQLYLIPNGNEQCYCYLVPVDNSTSPNE